MQAEARELAGGACLKGALHVQISHGTLTCSQTFLQVSLAQPQFTLRGAGLV